MRKKKELKFDGAFMEQMRIRNDLSLQELASKSGTSKSYIWELCQGKTEPSYMIAYKLSKTLGVDMKLFYAEVEKP
jgi:transcriptional regulator with XRE-family HTH domain